MCQIYIWHIHTYMSSFLTCVKYIFDTFSNTCVKARYTYLSNMYLTHVRKLDMYVWMCQTFSNTCVKARYTYLSWEFSIHIWILNKYLTYWEFSIHIWILNTYLNSQYIFEFSIHIWILNTYLTYWEFSIHIGIENSQYIFDTFSNTSVKARKLDMYLRMCQIHIWHIFCFVVISRRGSRGTRGGWWDNIYQKFNMYDNVWKESQYIYDDAIQENENRVATTHRMSLVAGHFSQKSHYI